MQERPDDPHWEKLPLPLAWLCELDRNDAPNSLKESFGDGYLYKNSSFFGRIRDSALELGYKYSCEDAPLLRDYNAIPLLTLRRILEERTIPYLDNGRSVNRLLQSQPKLSLPAGFLATIIRPNRVFHESAHCVAHAVWEPLQNDLERMAGGERAAFVLSAVFEESFANAVEHLGSGLSCMQVPDHLFYNLNSYMHKRAFQGELQVLLNSTEPRIAFRLLLFSLFEANLTDGDPTEAIRTAIGQAAGAGSEQDPELKAAVDLGFGLSPAFREKTTPYYFRLLGCAKDYDALAGTTWLADASHAEFARVLADMLYSRIVEPAWVESKWSSPQ
jgi:hypothetical protein